MGSSQEFGFPPQRSQRGISGVSQTILEHIGNTPIVSLDKISKEEGLECTLLAKCEFLSAGGSVKDRIALQMIEAAEREGKLVPGKNTIIEATSGNTGIGLALVAAVKGYRVIITLHDGRSPAKLSVLKALGAEVITAPSDEPWDSPKSYFSIAKRLAQEIPGAILLNQFGNPNNPNAHEFGTAKEIIQQLEISGMGPLDVLVAGAGTGGTITGLARGLKKKWKDVRIYAADPKGSVIARPQHLNTKQRFHLEGIGLPFVPDILDYDEIDSWIKVEDEESFNMSRRLIRSEGLLCGGTSGAAVVAAVKLAKQLQLGPDKTMLVILPDSIRDYIAKFIDDDWMRKNVTGRQP